ncbi:methyl-accepting chemotaxis protein [Salinibacter ruber]|uniref:methyl-accepting chemotaxis protein n=1 Tax=Salinibacter ruber TaxID=146919 RepID=UPI002166E02B|nr:methyl-accepting chemotaxis protein [Salinibacter ruber]MCS3640249.1 methyl-accepting chemotaxis protein [Salinibacter ruber]
MPSSTTAPSEAAGSPPGDVEASADTVAPDEIHRRFVDYVTENYRDVDFRFAVLMTVQWAAAIVAAVLISPNTWAGTESTMHVHVYAAVLLGGLISAPPALLAWVRPGTTLTRHLIAGAQLMMSGLLIHLSGGRIETHFHIFASLAFLSLYHDWRVLLTGAAVTGVDHVVRGIIWPESIYGVLTASPWRTVEHVAWVVFAVSFLAVGCVQAVRMYRRRAEQEAEAAQKNDRLDALLQDVKAAKTEAEEKREQADRLAEQSRVVRDYLEGEVERMLGAMNRLSDGDLTVEFEPGRVEDTLNEDLSETEALVDRLGDGFNRTVEQMRETLAEVDAAVEETATATRQVGAVADQLADGADRQHAQADEVATAVEEMSRTISSNADSATRAAEAAQQNGQQAETGAEVVGEAVEKMHEIADTVQDSARTVKELGASSEEIEEAVSIINDIADQTNLLALNAAIEAARTGEEGHGFAVVAEEVRELAERTAEATDDIAEMVAEIRDKADEAVSAMQQGEEQVQNGMALADEAGEALDKIVDGTQEAADTVSEIASATEEQSATSEQITQSVQGISEVSREAVTGIQQIADTVADMEARTDRLGRLVGHFTLGGEQAVGDPREAGPAANDAPADSSTQPRAPTEGLPAASSSLGDGAPD